MNTDTRTYTKYITQVKLSHNIPMEVQGGERMYGSYSFMTSALEGSEWCALYPQGKDPLCKHWTGGWVGPRAGLDTEVRDKILLPLSGIEPRSPSHQVHSQILY
jgi:hypothetical protein